MSRTPVVAGNWKQHGSLEMARTLATSARDAVLDGVKVVLCAPFPYLHVVGDVLRGSPIGLGAQDVSAHGAGAHTGEVGADMLRDLGCDYVILGHSERRADYGDTPRLPAKVRQALDAGLTPIFCVGETHSQRQSGDTESVVAEQLAPLLEAVAGDEWSRIVLAYEPVWAIGTGVNASPRQAQTVHAFIRQQLPADAAASVPLLYGGSVKPDNAADLFACSDVDGGLIGGASLQTDTFQAVCRAAALAELSSSAVARS